MPTRRGSVVVVVCISTPGSFLFLLENPHNDALTCFKCNITAQAMIGHGSYGPIFGSDDMRTPSDEAMPHSRAPNT
jgi:hypothetical protein